MFEPVILERFDGGAPLATTRISRYTVVFDRYCYDSPVWSPGQTGSVANAPSQRIASLVTGGRPQWPCRIACPNRKCDTIVTNAHYCVQRPLLCLTHLSNEIASLVTSGRPQWHAHYCYQPPTSIVWLRSMRNHLLIQYNTILFLTCHIVLRFRDTE